MMREVWKLNKISIYKLSLQFDITVTSGHLVNKTALKEQGTEWSMYC